MAGGSPSPIIGAPPLLELLFSWARASGGIAAFSFTTFFRKASHFFWSSIKGT
jgi:hypothetical protein